MAKKKLTLQQKKNDTFCRRCNYWKRKCDKLWSEIISKEFNGVCLADDCTEESYLNAHHILPKEKYQWLRYDLNNGVLLCSRGPSHHKFGWLSAHRNPVWFAYTLRRKYPDLWAIAVHRAETRPSDDNFDKRGRYIMDYKAKYEELLEIKEKV